MLYSVFKVFKSLLDVKKGALIIQKAKTYFFSAHSLLGLSQTSQPEELSEPL